MAAHLDLDDLRRAWEAEDPLLVGLVLRLARDPDPPPATPPRDGAPTFDRFLAEIRAKAFHKRPPEEQAAVRQERLRALESPTAEVPLSPRRRLHEILLALWAD